MTEASFRRRPSATAEALSSAREPFGTDLAGAGVRLPLGVPPIRCLFQPIVDLFTEEVVGFEVLARGIDDNSEAGNSDALFEWAKRTGRLVELDWACRIAAMRSALALKLPAGSGLFINVEPAALGAPPPAGFDELVEAVRDAGLAVVIEFTERALADNTSGLLRLGDWIREQGWSVAIDDIGADPGSLALVPLLKPEIIKLDLRLIQARTTVDVAQIVNAVNAEAGRTGALVLAEGIETERHAALAVSMGAHLGQGWYYGRPSASPVMQTAPLQLPQPRTAIGEQLPDVPWDLVSGSPLVRRAEKVLIEAMSRHLERQAMASTDPVVIVGAFQNADQYNAFTARRFAALAASGAVTAVLGRDIPDEPSVGVQGQHVSSHDRILREWSIAVVTAHFAGALISSDCGDTGPDANRRFDYVVTYDRDTVLAAAEIMLRRLVPLATGELERAESIIRPLPAEALRQDRQLPLLARAIASSRNGISIVDATAPDLPLVYVNDGFEKMTGYPAREALGRNCRFLQGPQTASQAVDQLRAMIASGDGGQVTILNYSRDGTPFWNEIHLSAVLDSAGTLTHFLALHTDVTARVDAARSQTPAPAEVVRPRPGGLTPRNGSSPTLGGTGGEGAPVGGKPDSPIAAALAESFSWPPWQEHAQPSTDQPRHAERSDPGSDFPHAQAYSTPVLHRPQITFPPAATPAETSDLQAPVAVLAPGSWPRSITPAPAPVANALTALPDRRAAQEYLKRMILAAEATNASTALLLCSIDRFPASSTGSDPSGDRVLVKMAAALGSVVDDGLLFRSAAEEFGAICRFEAKRDVVAAYALAGRMHRAVIDSVAADGVTMSVGIALSPADGTSVQRLWPRAEAALVLAEDCGPNATRYASDVPTVSDRSMIDTGVLPPVAAPARASSWPSW